MNQYRRKLTLIVGPDAGDAIDLSEFRVTFTVRRGDLQTPNSADVRIYNLSDQTANRIRKEFTRIVLLAGYAENRATIFEGSIKQVRRGRESAADTYVDVTAADGDEPYNFSYTALSLAAGTDPKEVLSSFIRSMAKQGLDKKALVPNLNSNGCLRGRVYYGMTKDLLREFAEDNDCTWSIQGNALTLIPLGGYLPSDIPIISPSTGLIGIPEQRQNGIHMRVLLNPLIRIGQVVRLDSTVNQFRFDLGREAMGTNPILQGLIKTNTDGLYYVMVANHAGDTRGNDWFTDLICLSVDATTSPAVAFDATVFDNVSALPRY